MKHKVGDVFGRWTLIEYHFPGQWTVKCSCGTVKITPSVNNITSGKSVSCGCYRSETLNKDGSRSRKHGLSKHPAYRSWIEAKRRCYNPSTIGYRHYGQRGIKVCESWHSFSNFWKDMGESWFEGGTIDRIDFNGDYCPENCRWIKIEEQGRNRRGVVRVTWKGVSMTLAQAAIQEGYHPHTIARRLKAGMTLEQALTQQSRKKTF